MTTSLQNNNHKIDQINRYLNLGNNNSSLPNISGKNVAVIAAELLSESDPGRGALQEIVKENESFLTKKTLGKTLLVAGIAIGFATVVLLVIPGLNVIPSGFIAVAGIAGAISFSAIGARIWQVTAGKDRENIETVKKSLEKLKSPSQNQDPPPVRLDKEENNSPVKPGEGLLSSRKVNNLAGFTRWT